MKAPRITPQQKVAQTILIVLAVLAALAGIGALADLADAEKATLAVETWRAVGLFTFAALFSLLAKRPSGNRELWSIIIANKLALSLIGAVYMIEGGVAGASDFVTFDGGITVLLIVASVLAGVWKRKSAH